MTDLVKFYDLHNGDYTPVTYNFVAIDGVRTGYRQAGSRDKPVLFLLHGYPSSSFMFRNIIPLLASHFYVIAPDLPGFGFSDVPPRERFDYTFDGYAAFIESFLQQLDIKKATFYLFDYGAPIVMRIIARRPEMVDMLIFQNGNIYTEGIGEVLKKTRRLLDEDSPESQQELSKLFELEYTKWEYLNGVGDILKVAPEAYMLDQFLLERDGVKDIQLALKDNYKTNLALYPFWQQKLQELQPPTLIVWGEHDEVFTKQGAVMLKRDLSHTSLIFYPTGHFALEEYGNDIAREIILFWNIHVNR